MCARYAFFTGKITNDEIGVVPLPDLEPRWNISPGQWAPVALEFMGVRQMLPMKWGLVPSWADPATGTTRVNARAETAREKPSFKAAFRSRRCLIPADGYYEWSDGQPYYIHPRAGNQLLMAGLYEEHEGMQTFAVLTCDASQALAEIHPRMPVILSGKDARQWLTTDWGGGDAVPLDSVGADVLAWHPVNKRVGRVSEEGASLILPLEPDQGSLF